MSRRPMSWLALAATVSVAAWLSMGCAQTPSTETPAEQATSSEVAPEQNAASPSVEKAREAGQMAMEIEKDPNRANQVLEAHHMTSEEFQALMLEIAQDPALTEAYEAERTGS